MMDLWILIFEIIKIFLEIAVLYLMIYSCLRFIQGTRGSAMLLGGFIILSSLTFMVVILRSETLEWLLNYLWAMLPILLTIIFQTEIRRGLSQIGVFRHNFNGLNYDESKILAKVISEVAQRLSEKKIGSLIALERNIGLRSYADTGILLGADITVELLLTIFYPKTALHDGGVIIRENKIIAAKCIFPLAVIDSSSEMGTRHRAGIGLSEESDAFVVITSEETGKISFAVNGKIKSGLTSTELKEIMMGYFAVNQTQNIKKDEVSLRQECETLLVTDTDDESEA